MKAGRVGSFMWANKSLSDDDAKKITSLDFRFQEKKYQYDKFWNTHLLSVRTEENQPLKSFSRLTLVDRVSNTLGASHKFTPPTSESSEVDRILYQLFKIVEIFEVPLPYFACLKISQEILTAHGLWEDYQEK
jgi:hypothetical protein